MSDSQQPGAAGDDEIPPIPPAPTLGVPSAPPVPPTPEAPAPSVSSGDQVAAEPFAAPEPVNPYVPQPSAAPSPSAPVPPVTPAVAQPANPYAAAPANPYVAAPGHPYTAPGGGAPATLAYAAQPAYTAAPAGPSRLNVMGLVSLILGCAAFLFGVSIGWIPFVGFFFVLLALIGVILGIVGLVAKNKGKGLAIAGTAVSGVALLATAAISVIMLIFALSFSSTIDDFEWDDDPVVTDPDEDYGTTDEDPLALGGRDNPLTVGDTATLIDYAGDDQWQVVVGAPNLDATADVLAASEYNDEPDPGDTYIVIPMTVTYLGEGSDLPYTLYAELLTPTGDIHDVSFAEYPGDIYSSDELATGESVEVNLVYEVASDSIVDSMLRIGWVWGDDLHVRIG